MAPEPKLKIGFLGTGKIAMEHCLAAKDLGHMVVAGSATSINSGNWKEFSSIAPEARFEPSGRALLTDPNIDAVISCLPWNVTEEWLPFLLTSTKPILIEKPIALSSHAAEKAVSQPNAKLSNKIVGYNRRFYKPVQKLKERLSEGGLKAVEITVSETVDRLTKSYGPEIAEHILAYSSSHIIDTAMYLLGKIKPVHFYKYRNKKHPLSFCSLIGILETGDGIPVLLSINAENPVSVGIRMYFDDETTWHLSPMERLVAYKGYEVIEPNQKIKIRQYKSKPFFESTVDQKLKPGFLEQMKAFTTGKKGIAATPKESIELLHFIENMVKIANEIPNENYK